MKGGKGHDNSAIKCSDGKFHGPSKNMEVAAAKNLFKRTTQANFPFRYKVFVADGDANVAKTIQGLNLYGDEVISKEECMYHLRKRFRKNLTEVFNKSGFKRGMVYRYPFRDDKDNLACRFSNLYLFMLRKTIIENRNGRDQDSIDKMCNVVKSIPRHYMDHSGASLDHRRTKYHVNCTSSFCDYVRTPEHEQEKYIPKNKDGGSMDGELWLPEAISSEEHQNILNKIIGVFDEHATPSLMSRCTRYLNQNVNESVHARLYRVINKTIHYSRLHVNFACQQTMSVHNSGYRTASLLNKLGATKFQLDKLKIKDETMQLRAEKCTKKPKPPFEETEVHYKSGYGFEDHDPLPESDEFRAREKMPWHNLDQNHVAEDPTVDYVSEDV